MNLRRTITLIVVGVLGIMNCSPLFADSPAVINYQGKLADANGNPQSGTFPMIFRIYDALTNGTLLFTDDRATQQVPVANGIFNVLIGTGSITGNLTTTLQGGTSRYLQVTVNSTNLSPRQRLVASPYALAVAQGSISDAEVASGAGISVTKLGAGTFPSGNYSFVGSTLTVSSMTITDMIDMNGRPIQNLPTTPSSSNDAASKSYVDSQVGGATQWTTNGSNIGYTAGFVGVGTTSPTTALDVNGGSTFRSAGFFTVNTPIYYSGALILQNTNLTNGNGVGLFFNDGSGLVDPAAITARFTTHTPDAANLNFVTASTERMTVTSAGNVGIGTTNPGAQLEVQGDVKIVDGTQGTGKVLTSDANGLASWQATGSGVPSGAVMFFNLAGCPSGWTELTAARGRYIVGLPAGGTLAGTDGTALSNLEDRPVGLHSHAAGGLQVIVDSNWGSNTNASAASRDGVGAANGNISGTTANAGTVAGTNAPYIQLLTCEKN